MNPSRNTRSLLVALSVMGAGAIHLAAIRSHLGSPAAIASFTGIGLIQILLGLSFLQPGPLRIRRFAVVAVAGVALIAWAASRTMGLPAVSGHTGPEAIGLGDAAGVALQLIALLLVLLPARPTSQSSTRYVTRNLIALPVVALSIVASYSLLSVPPHGHSPAPVLQVSTVSDIPAGPTAEKLASIPPKSVPAPTHVDPPGAAAHSH